MAAIAGNAASGLRSLPILLAIAAVSCTNGSQRHDRSTDGLATPEEGHRTADSWDSGFAPTLVLNTPLKNLTRHIGDKVIFDCEITGSPTPKYKWFKDDEELPKESPLPAGSSSTSRRFAILEQDWGSRLRISAATEDDKGTYRCLAENASGSKHTVAVLRLKSGALTATPTLTPKVTMTTPEDDKRRIIHPMTHSDDDDVEPYCQQYKGTACRMLGGQQIFVTSRRSQHLADSRIIRVITELANYLPAKENSQCWLKVHEATCRSQLPLCATENHRSYGRRLCRADCEALFSLCRPEFRDQKIAFRQLPNCGEASSNSDCVSINLASSLATSATVGNQREHAATNADEDLGHMLKIVIPCSIGVIAVVAIVGGVCACKRRRRSGAAGKGLAATAAGSKEQKNAQESMGLVSTLTAGGSRGGAAGTGDKIAMAPAPSGNSVAFVKEVPNGNVHAVQELGESEFGKVFVGQVLGLFGPGTSSVVYVKALRDRAPPSLSLAFRKEIEDAVELRHQHVALLLGVSLGGSPQCAFYEYLPAGDLHQVLLSRSAAAGSSADGVMGGGSSGGGGIIGQPSQQPLQPSSPLQLREQMYVVTQVASALEYLTSVGRVHGDVAARNVLVGHGLIIKLSNLSIAFGLYSADYCQLHGRPMPVRWLSPEAIAYGRRSHESDVYSFGVLLWEVFADAADRPYAGCSNQEVMALVRSRQLLPCPPACPPRIYSLMMECWHESPIKRPAPRELHQKLRAWYLDGTLLTGPVASASVPQHQQQQQVLLQPMQQQQPQLQPVVDWLAATAAAGGGGCVSPAPPSLQSYSSGSTGSGGCSGAGGPGAGNPSNSTNLTEVRSSGGSNSVATTSIADGSPAVGSSSYGRQAPYGGQASSAVGAGRGAASTMSPGGFLDAGAVGCAADTISVSSRLPAFSSPHKRLGDPPLLSGDY